MKRIKLFEAFNNEDKIEKVNFLLFNWAVKEFIAEEDLKFKMLSLPNKSDVFFIQKVKDFPSDYFKCEVALRASWETRSSSSLRSSSPALLRRMASMKTTIINIYCHFELRKFFEDKNIISTYDVVDYEIVKRVIKKIYQDEKDKTI